MSPTLKPCPFCGGEAEIDTLWTYRVVYDGQMGRGVSIYCLSCNSQMEECYSEHPGEEREDVCAALVEAWNTRALEREAKAEPVAWKVRIPRGSDAYEIRFASTAEQLREMEAKWPLALVEPLYASPPAPETP